MSRKQLIFNLLPRTASQADNFADRYRIGTTAALLSSIGLIAVASITTNFTVTGNSNPLISSAYKTGNGWSSGDYFGRRSSAPVAEQQIAHSFRQGNGWSSGNYFGPKG